MRSIHKLHFQPSSFSEGGVPSYSALLQDFLALLPSHMLFTLLLANPSQSSNHWSHIVPGIPLYSPSQYRDVNFLCSTCLNLKLYINLTIYSVFPQLDQSFRRGGCLLCFLLRSRAKSLGCARCSGDSC